MAKQTIVIDKVDLTIPEDFSKLDRYSQVKNLVEQILEKKKINNAKIALSGKTIFQIIERSYPDHQIPQNTFTVYLSKLVESNDSKINCLGKKQGYYLLEKVDEAISSTESNRLYSELVL